MFFRFVLMASDVLRIFLFILLASSSLIEVQCAFLVDVSVRFRSHFPSYIPLPHCWCMLSLLNTFPSVLYVSVCVAILFIVLLSFVFLWMCAFYILTHLPSFLMFHPSMLLLLLFPFFQFFRPSNFSYRVFPYPFSSFSFCLSSVLLLFLSFTIFRPLIHAILSTS